MNNSDPLQCLLVDFFNLPPETSASGITQQAIESWDSLAMVQLIADLQGTFLIEFDLDEIGSLRSYKGIHRALSKKGVALRGQRFHDREMITSFPKRSLV